MLHTGSPRFRRRWRWLDVVAWSVLPLSPWISPASAADKTHADYFIHSLPGAPEPLLKMHAGHVEVSPEHHGNLFFWHYQNRHIGDRQRTVIWLNGGPGCSSMDGAMMEIGPYRVKKDQTLEYNLGSWDEFANLLFIDNPVGTGFSYVDSDSFVHELDDMANQMITFLEKWFLIFPEYSHDDLYIAGESYAGQHIPYIAQAILDRNAKTQDPQSRWNLSGLLIGNGWVAPTEQYFSYSAYAYEAGLLIDGSDQAKAVEAQQGICANDLNKSTTKHVDMQSCEMILQEILRVTQENSQCFNLYDVRLKDSYPSCGMNWPPDLEQVTPYLRRDDVTKALHLSSDLHTGWTECSGQVGSNFRAVNSKPSIELLPGILEKVPIVLFSGEKDLICNHLGTEEFINKMTWNGGTGFEIYPGTWAPRRDWTFEGEAAGIYQSARNLTYILFYDSSHMVPFDYPRRTRDMLDRFLGVDIASIGGTPADSRIDGEKGLETSVGGHPNSTAAEEAEKNRLQQATWDAYYRSGEVALVVVLIAALAWGYFVWRDRRRRAGYSGVIGGDPYDGPGGRGGLNGGLGLNGFRDRRSERDMEAADFDEAELDDLNTNGHAKHSPAQEQFYVGDDSEDEALGRKENGHAR